MGSTKAFAGPSHLLQSRFDDDDDDRERTRSIALMCLLCLFLIWPSKIVIVGIELFPFLKYIDNPKNSLGMFFSELKAIAHLGLRLLLSFQRS